MHCSRPRWASHCLGIPRSWRYPIMSKYVAVSTPDLSFKPMQADGVLNSRARSDLMRCMMRRPTCTFVRSRLGSKAGSSTGGWTGAVHSRAPTLRRAVRDECELGVEEWLWLEYRAPPARRAGPHRNLGPSTACVPVDCVVGSARACTSAINGVEAKGSELVSSMPMRIGATVGDVVVSVAAVSRETVAAVVGGVRLPVHIGALAAPRQVTTRWLPRVARRPCSTKEERTPHVNSSMAQARVGHEEVAVAARGGMPRSVLGDERGVVVVPRAWST